MKKFAIYALTFTIALSFLTFIVSADDNKDDDKKPWKGSIRFGGIYSDADEADYINTNPLTGGRVAEYGIAESAAILGIDLTYMGEDGNMSFINGALFDADNANASIFAAMNRMFFIQADFKRFVHRLDNDNLLDWSDSYITFDDEALNDEMIMRMNILNSGIKFKPEAFPGAAFFAHVRIIGREGDQQARTLNEHCSNCHMTSQTMAFDTQTLEYVVGAEYSQQGFAAKYEFKNRSVSVDSESPTVVVGAASFHPWNWGGNGDTISVLETPENSFMSNSGEARVDFNSQGSLYGKFSVGEYENDNTGFTQDMTYYVGKANFYANDWVRLKGMFEYYELSSNVPGMYASNDLINGFGFNRTRFAGAVIIRPMKELKLEGKYTMEDWEREGTHNAEESSINYFQVKGMYRPNRQFRLRASWKYVDRENPIGHAVKDHGLELPGIYQAFQGTEENHFKVNALFTPDDKITLSFNFSYMDEEGTEVPNNSLNTVPASDAGLIIIGPTTQPSNFVTMNSSLDLEATRIQTSVTANFEMSEDAGIYGDYSYFDNSWKRDTYFGTKSGRPQYFFLDDYRTMDYEGSGNTLSLGAWLRAGTVLIYPSWSYTDVESGYDHSVTETTALDANTVETTINRLKLKASMPINDDLWITLGYFLDKYEENYLPDGSGEINMFFGWLKYKF